MRSGSASRHERILRVFERHASKAIEARLSRVRIDDQPDGKTIVVDGRRLLNFGSCAYLGLNVDRRLKEGAIAAVEQYGPVFSSSTAYTSVDLYSKLEERLERIFDAPVVVPTTTTLGHLAALPVLVGPGDAVVVDSQAHSTVHLATQVLAAEGIPVVPVTHNSLAALDEALDRLVPEYRSVWYLADGVYSMLGDVAPVDAILERQEAYPNLYVYYDDAHGFGWQGRAGRGHVLHHVGLNERTVVAVSLAKSFGSGGAAIAFPDRELAHRVQILGGTLTFSGPVHPAELGAAVASADIHLSDEHPQMQHELREQIAQVRALVGEMRIPVPSCDESPIWFARVGHNDDAVEVASRLMADGFFVNLASFPAVAMGQSGIRFTHTRYHTHAEITALLERMAEHIDDVVGLGPAEVTGILVDLTDGADSLQDAAPKTRV